MTIYKNRNWTGVKGSIYTPGFEVRKCPTRLEEMAEKQEGPRIERFLELETI